MSQPLDLTVPQFLIPMNSAAFRFKERYMTGFKKDLPAWGISLLINLSVLASLHFVVMRQHVAQELDTIVSDLTDISENDQFNFSDRTDMEEVVTSQGGGTGSGTGTGMGVGAPTMAATAPGRDAPLQEKLEGIMNPDIAVLSEGSLPRLEGNVTSTVSIRGGADSAPGGVSGAMDRAAFEIQQSLKQRRTLVFWLMDASGSVEKRREAIADRFDNIYRQLGEAGTTEGLYSVVVSYQEKAQLLTPEPLQDTRKLSEIVRTKIQWDKSTGKENVFGALRLTLEKFRTYDRSGGPWNRLVFIVTDEKGDDAEQHLEDVITLAKRTQTKVYTIGNAAVFGLEKGYVEYKHEDGFVELVAVDQGPETAFPDGVQLPFIGSQSDWRLNQMSSSYGPYALSRLCAETGGLYLITEESRGYAFDRSIMRRYTPDYRPIRVQEAEISRNAAKTALVNVARMSYVDSLPTPTLEFRGYNDNILRQDLTEAQKPVAEIDVPLRRMYETLKMGESARDKLKEDRWRAAYDLAMGRILAMRVRFAGYNLMLANMKVSPKAFTTESGNMWRLVPSDKIESGVEMRKAAEMAKVYLRRVIDEHPGTPWAMLAEKELTTEMGWSWQEFSRPIPGSNQLRAPQEEVARLLLADEQQRREMNRNRPSGPQRETPKL